MIQFNEQFYELLDNDNLLELLKLCKSPGIKIDIETKVLYIKKLKFTLIYIKEIVYKYYEISTKYEKEQINNYEKNN